MKIAAFNVQKFGEKKVRDAKTLGILVKIISRYDIIIILEVVDKSEDSVGRLFEELNSANKDHPYCKKLSSRQGTSDYKEQFLFFYRKNVVRLKRGKKHEYKHEDTHDLEREPFTLRFTLPNTALKDIVLIAVHTKPQDTKKELEELYEVVMEVKEKWQTENIMILGDFNAAGRYLSKKSKDKLKLVTDKNVHWIICDTVDTTVSAQTDHAYDRIVVYGDNMWKAVVGDSAKAFNFHKEYELSEQEALEVSDHYPVEVELDC